VLCSCYPWAVLGLPPVWYKSFAYRSRTVKEPRRVLQMVTAKGLADAAALSRTREAWNRAVERTPHGTPIELGTEDFS